MPHVDFFKGSGTRPSFVVLHRESLKKKTIYNGNLP
jgi:hypothetical protein